MAFLVSRTDQRVRVYWTGDPAVKAGKADDEDRQIIRSESAGKRIRRGGSAPDEFVVRPLSNREFLGLGAYASDSAGMAFAAVEVCCLGIEKINRSDGSTVDDEEQIRALVDSGSPPEFISAMSQFIVELTTAGGQKKTS